MPAPRHPEQVIRAAILEVGECWIWQRSKCVDGYGKMNNRLFPTETLAHRISYRIFNGAIPAGTEIDHLCRNRACVNPKHLCVLPHLENVRRGVRLRERHRNAKKTHCLRGHPLIGANLIRETWRGRTMRKCRACKQMRAKSYALPALSR